MPPTTNLSDDSREHRPTTDSDDHLLVTVLGTQSKETRYTFEGVEVSACLAPLALLELLPEHERPHRVMALCTEDAKAATGQKLQQDLEGRCPVEIVSVPEWNDDNDDQTELSNFLETVSDTISRSGATQLTIDITHGFRHLSFLMYTTVLYLTALRGFHLRGAYYGLQRQNKPSLFLDLAPLLDLPRWFHAVRVLQETGSAVPIATLLAERATGQNVQRLASDLRTLSNAYLSGLPLELARSTSIFLKDHAKPLTRLLRNVHRLPLASDLRDSIETALAPYRPSVPLVSGKGWKQSMPLTEDELKRQARLVDDLLERSHIAAALGLMREWTVSWVIDRMGSGDKWIDHNAVRPRAERLLGMLAAAKDDPALTDVMTSEQRDLAEFYSKLQELRNSFHHHGMRGMPLLDADCSEKFEAVTKYWRETLRTLPTFTPKLGGGGGGIALVSPIGKRPGVLYSAIEAVRRDRKTDPTMCLVVCSQQTEASIDEALSHARYDGNVERLTLVDPHGGIDEIESLVGKVKRRLIEVEEVWVNVTGGTTLMGLAAERLAAQAKGLDRKVRRFGLIDRRPPEDQDADPYQIGDVFWIDYENDTKGRRHAH